MMKPTLTWQLPVSHASGPQWESAAAFPQRQLNNLQQAPDPVVPEVTKHAKAARVKTAKIKKNSSVSVLTLSGPFALVAEPMFTAPIAVFLATRLTSIIFAMLAAQPRFVRSKETLEDFNEDKANTPVFEQFSSLNITGHSKVMTGLLRNNKRIY